MSSPTTFNSVQVSFSCSELKLNVMLRAYFGLGIMFFFDHYTESSAIVIPKVQFSSHCFWYAYAPSVQTRHSIFAWPVNRTTSILVLENGGKNRDLRRVLRPSGEGAGCKTRLESRIKKGHRHDTNLAVSAFESKESMVDCSRILDLRTGIVCVCVCVCVRARAHLHGALHPRGEASVGCLQR